MHAIVKYVLNYYFVKIIIEHLIVYKINGALLLLKRIS